MDLDVQLSAPLQTSLFSTLGELFWYALMASAAWLFFYVACRAAFRHRRVSRSEPTTRQVCREVGHSLRSIAVFGLVTLAIALAALAFFTLTTPSTLSKAAALICGAAVVGWLLLTFTRGRGTPRS